MENGGDETPTLAEWAGGEEAIGRMIDASYDRVEQDPDLSDYFPGGVSAEHRLHVTWWWTEVFHGGPRYSSQLDGYKRMVDHHRGLGITAEHRRTFVSTMSAAAAPMPHWGWGEAPPYEG